MFAGYLNHKKTSLRNGTRGRKTFRNINTFIRTLTVGIRSEANISPRVGFVRFSRSRTDYRR